MTMKQVNALMPIIFSLATGCATLTPEATQIKIISDGAVMAMMNCEELGHVSGASGIWGGTLGLEKAVAEAKNKAADISGANAIMITNSRMNPTSVVNASVFNCSERKTQKIELVNPSPESQPSQQEADREETFRKAKACQDKGGVWIDDQCVIDIN